MTRVLLQKNSVVSLTSSWKSCRKITSLCYYYSSAPSVLEVVRQILRHHFLIIRIHTIFHYWLSATPKIAKKKNSEMNLHLFLHYSCSQCRKKNCNPNQQKRRVYYYGKAIRLATRFTLNHTSFVWHFHQTVTRHESSSSLFHFTYESKINSTKLKAKQIYYKISRYAKCNLIECIFTTTITHPNFTVSYEQRNSVFKGANWKRVDDDDDGFMDENEVIHCSKIL